MVKKLFTSIIFTFTFILNSFSQELNCVIYIDGTNAQLTSADKTLLDNFKTAATTFINNRRWTTDVFSPEEKIKCNIYITISSVPQYGSFIATASIQAARPIYESSYESTLLNYFDKNFNFDFNPSQPFDFNENTYYSNLTSMLGFYAYIILGMDYDSFSKLGGTPWFEKARNIANVAQSGGDESWSQTTSSVNRYTLIANITNQQYLPLREGLYTYHRIALDQFIKDPQKARKEIFEVLKKIRPIQMYDPSSIFIRSLFLAKSVEIINIYKDDPTDLKNQVVELLRNIDPLNGDKYSTKILNK